MPLELPDGFTVGDLEGDVTDLRALLTHFGLLAPGDRSLFKVYTSNADDREIGSNGVDITWPAA